MVYFLVPFKRLIAPKAQKGDLGAIFSHNKLFLLVNSRFHRVQREGIAYASVRGEV